MNLIIFRTVLYYSSSNREPLRFTPDQHHVPFRFVFFWFALLYRYSFYIATYSYELRKKNEQVLFTVTVEKTKRFTPDGSTTRSLFFFFFDLVLVLLYIATGRTTYFGIIFFFEYVVVPVIKITNDKSVNLHAYFELVPFQSIWFRCLVFGNCIWLVFHCFALLIPLFIADAFFVDFWLVFVFICVCFRFCFWTNFLSAVVYPVHLYLLYVLFDTPFFIDFFYIIYFWSIFIDFGSVRTSWGGPQMYSFLAFVFLLLFCCCSFLNEGSVAVTSK